MKTKKLVNYSISKTLKDAFLITASIKGDNMSAIVESAILDYVIKNKAEVNEKLLEDAGKAREQAELKIDEINNIKRI